MDALLARHLIGPMVLVMPTINGPGRQFQECVNGPAVNDETYLTKDVRTDVFAHFRVSHDPYEWGLSGYSSGGYCAANLALRHPSSFGAAAVINGYFRAADGPAAGALNNSQPLEAANSPLYLAERLTLNSSHLPAFWVAAGTNDRPDYKPATMFAAAMDRVHRTSPAGPPVGPRRWSSSTSITPTWRNSSRPRCARRRRSGFSATPGSTWTWAARTSRASSTRTRTTRSGSPMSSCGRSSGTPSSTWRPG